MERKILFSFIITFLIIFSFVSCEEEKLEKSIFDTDIPELDPNEYTYKFDSFLVENFRKPYNLQFLYKMQDVGTDMSYNLIPATLTNSKRIAVLVKYLWYDVYSEVVEDKMFLKKYGPKIIHLIGSASVNPWNGTEIMGLAEGAVKISLFKLNTMDLNDLYGGNGLNERYFKTMHHEFGHILTQKKTRPSAFNYFSPEEYKPDGWEKRHFNVTASLGFVSPYAGSEVAEDFVETIANYIVKTDVQWANLLDIASKEWKQTDEENPGHGVQQLKEGDEGDGIDGKEKILAKVKMCSEWLKEAFNLDLDALRNEVQKRQVFVNKDYVEALLKEYGIE